MSYYFIYEKNQNLFRKVWRTCAGTEHSSLCLFQEEVHILWYCIWEMFLNPAFAFFSSFIFCHLCLWFMTGSASWPSHILFLTPGIFLSSHPPQLSVLGKCVLVLESQESPSLEVASHLSSPSSSMGFTVPFICS